MLFGCSRAAWFNDVSKQDTAVSSGVTFGAWLYVSVCCTLCVSSRHMYGLELSYCLFGLPPLGLRHTRDDLPIIERGATQQLVMYSGASRASAAVSIRVGASGEEGRHYNSVGVLASSLALTRLACLDRELSTLDI